MDTKHLPPGQPTPPTLPDSQRWIPEHIGKYAIDNQADIWSYVKSPKQWQTDTNQPIKVTTIKGKYPNLRKLIESIWPEIHLVPAPPMDKHNAKLSPDQVTQIRDMLATGLTQQSIATQFNISQPVISYIVNSSRKGTASVRTIP